LLRWDNESETRYAGTRSQFIAAGMGQDGDFPGDPGAPSCTHVVSRNGKKMRISVHSRVANPITFWISIAKPRPPCEIAAPSEEEIADQEQHDALQRAIDSGTDLGVVRRDYAWGMEWIGLKEDLKATGVCEERHFPSARKRVLYAEPDQDDGRPGVEWWLTRAIRKGYFAHRVWLDDRTRRRLDKNQQLEDDPDALADRVERCLMGIQKGVISMMRSEGYALGSVRYDESTIAKVEGAMEHARQLLQSAMPAKPTPRRSRPVDAAKGDGAFRLFLAAALQPAKGPRKRRS
jgi:hypothetical protein